MYGSHLRVCWDYVMKREGSFNIATTSYTVLNVTNQHTN